MKPSHYVTPRCMADAVWQPWGSAVEAHRARSWTLADLAIACMAVGLVAAITGGWL